MTSPRARVPVDDLPRTVRNTVRRAGYPGTLVDVLAFEHVPFRMAQRFVALDGGRAWLLSVENGVATLPVGVAAVLPDHVVMHPVDYRMLTARASVAA